MQFSTDVTFPAPVEAVAGMLATEAYVRETVAATGSAGRVEVVRAPDGTVTITTRQRLSADRIPAAYRSLVGGSLEIHRVDVWEAPAGSSRHGTLAIDVTGAPVRVTGTLALAPAAEGSSLTFAGVVKAAVPFVARAIERAIAERVDEAVAIERDVGTRWLAGG